MRDFRQIPDAVNLMEVTAVNQSTVSGEEPLHIVTVPQQWAYAALWPVHDHSDPGLDDGAQCVVRVAATVERGRIGFAIVKEDLEEFITNEIECGANAERQTIEIAVVSPRPGMHFVVRNTAPGGTVSAVWIHSIVAGVGIRETAPQAEEETDVFDTSEALQINRARLAHLASLELPIDGKSVLDVGCGVGHLSEFFAKRGCRITCVDARPENLARLEALYPGRETHIADVEVDSLAARGQFDIVFCYGLLYHTENPMAALRNMASCCRELLLLESVVTDHPRPIVQFVDEPNTTRNQAVFGLGCRPSPAFIAMALARVGFSFVYTTGSQPDFPDFQFDPKKDSEWQRDGHLLRRVFVASRTPLTSSGLILLHEAPALMATGREVGKLAVTSATQVWLDVGAHLGEKTFSIAAQTPNIRVYAFEPNLSVASQLMGRLPNYIVLPLAVAELDGSAPFYVNSFDAASSLLPFVADGLKQWVGGEALHVDAVLTAPTIRLDTFLDRTGIRKVSYLKIDAQGSDLAVIRSLGTRLRDVECISLEVQITATPLYRDGSRKSDVVRLLTEAGFELVACEKQSHDQEENLTFARPSGARDAALI